MINFKKIFTLLSVALLLCTFAGVSFSATAAETSVPPAPMDGQSKKTESPKFISANQAHDQFSVSGCSANTGLFANLVKTGREIFVGLRDLIYVVAGFGIIAVAVGGFFGNLNWKWLGALVIGLVVIASTGELINAVTGCKDFTKNMIQDTLK